MVFTLLQIVQQAEMELGLPSSATVVGNADLTTVQMYALTNRVLDELRRFNQTGWTAMMNEYDLVVQPPLLTTGNVTNDSAVITNIPSTTGLIAQYFQVGGNAIPQAARLLSVDSPTQVTMTMEATGSGTQVALVFARDTYPYPTDWDFTQNRTQWDRTNRWELLGPDSPQMDQWHRSGVVAWGPRRHFRKIGDLGSQFRIWPAPAEITDPLQLAFEYLSLNAVATHGSVSTGTTRFFQNDDDTPLLDDQAIVMGLKWRFWQIKGFNYADLKNDWLDYVSTLVSRDEGAQTLNMVQRVSPIFISPSNVQDGFFPGPVGPNLG